jgi:hypothetical protein
MIESFYFVSYSPTSVCLTFVGRPSQKARQGNTKHSTATPVTKVETGVKITNGLFEFLNFKKRIVCGYL